MAEKYTVIKDFELEEIGSNKWRLKTFIGFETPENIEIPAEINGKKIVEIGEKLFFNNKEIKQVKIAEGIQVIGKSAFEDCGVKKVELPKGLKRIKDSAFRHCRELFDINFPNGLKKIEESVFSGCYKFDIVLPETLEFIGDRAFLGCCPINPQIVLPKSIKKIGKHVLDFYYDLVGEREKKVVFVFLEGCNAVLEDEWCSTYVSRLYIPSSVEVKWLPSVGALYCHAGSSAMTCARSKGIRCEDYDKAMQELKRQEEKAIADRKQKQEQAKRKLEQEKKEEAERNIPISQRDYIRRGDYWNSQNITIPAHIKTIREHGCDSRWYDLKLNFEPGSQLEVIEGCAFCSCKIKQKRIVIPKTVRRIGNCGFDFGYTVKEICFEEGSAFEELGENAFSGIKTLILPPSCKKIVPHAFKASYIKTVIVPTTCDITGVTPPICGKIIQKDVSAPVGIVEKIKRLFK